MDRASVSVAVDVGLDSESGQTNDLNIDIHSFSLLDVQHQKEQCGDSTTTTIVYFFSCVYFSMIPP